MCLIVHLPAGVVVTPKLDKVLNEAVFINSDGYGIMSYEHKRPVIHKGLDMDKGIEKFLSIPSKYPRAMHLRYGTHGPKSVKNCHPFPSHTWFMMHNGVFKEYAKDKDKSDSKLFAENFGRIILKYPPEDFEVFLQSYCGWDNRLLLMSDKGEFRRVGVWYEENGMWYSNILNLKDHTYLHSLKRLAPNEVKQIIKEDPDYILALISRS